MHRRTFSNTEPETLVGSVCIDVDKGHEGLAAGTTPRFAVSMLDCMQDTETELEAKP
jgi:hypothetical protein